MKTSEKLYSMVAVENAVEELAGMGYEIIKMYGSLLDDYICISNDDKKYNFYFYETFLNAWASSYKMQRFTKLTGKMAEMFKARFLEQDEETKSYIEGFIEKII